MTAAPVLWHELTKAQAITLLPEAPGKELFLTSCMNCHGMGKIVGRRDVQGWLDAIDTMRRVGVTTPTNPRPAVANEVAGYLAEVLGPDSPTPVSPASLPGYKPLTLQWSDEALNIVYVDYPVKAGPAGRPGVGEMDAAGIVWMETDNGLIKLDPATGESKAFYVPDSMGDQGGMHEVVRDRLDPAVLWLTAQSANALVRFDSRTETFEVYRDPTKPGRVTQIDPNTPNKFPRVQAQGEGQAGTGRKHTAVVDLEGNVWTTGRPLMKFNPKTKEWTSFADSVPDVYGIDVDQAGNVWFAEFNSAENGSVGMVDVKTGKLTKFKPPSPEGRPRRLHVDSKGNIWFGQYFNGSIGKFDPKTKQFVEYKLPGPYPTVYGFGIDKNDHVWGVSHFNEATFEVTPAGKVTAYPSPYLTRGTRDLKVGAQNRMWGGIQPEYKIGYFYVRKAEAGGTQ